MNTFDTSSMKAGDAARGHAIFEGKGACLSCHRVNGRGQPESAGPFRYRRIAQRGVARTIATRSSRQMIPINRPVRAVTRDGKMINGRRLNEDTYTVQLTDEEGRLHSLTNRICATRSRHVDDAVIRERLTREELADVVAYLLT